MFKDTFAILFSGKTARRFILGVFLSFSYSIAVILSTIGIMDGFNYALKKNLKQSSGDLTIYSRDGFFELEEKMVQAFKDNDIINYTAFVQTEGFLIFKEKSKGVVVKGVDPSTFQRVTNLKLNLAREEVAIGIELSRQLAIRVGDSIIITFANGNKVFSSLPLLKRYRVVQIVRHGIYDKDLRFVYLPLKDLQVALELENVANLLALNIPLAIHSHSAFSDSQAIERVKESLEFSLGPDFVLRPFWQEYGPLLEAVKIEKFSISLILQIVVIISIFNVVAFIVYLNEKRAQEIFLMQALGTTKKQLTKLWFILVLVLWFFSCVGAVALAEIFNLLLWFLPIFKLPGDVYALNHHLSLKIDFWGYLYVFAGALFWILLITTLTIMRIRKKSILSGLREEFA